MARPKKNNGGGEPPSSASIPPPPLASALRSVKPKGLPPLEAAMAVISSSYREDLAIEILTRLGCGESLTTICKSPGMPTPSHVVRWVLDPERYCAPKEFPALYAKARELGLHIWADEMKDIADDGRNDWMERNGGDAGVQAYVFNGEAVQRSKLRIATIQWTLARLLPMIYSERQQQQHTGANGGPIEHTLRIERVIVDPKKIDG